MYYIYFEKFYSFINSVCWASVRAGVLLNISVFVFNTAMFFSKMNIQ